MNESAGASGIAEEGMSPPDASRDQGPASPDPASADAPRLRVFLLNDEGIHAEDFQAFPLTPNRWERIRLSLPDTWRGQGLLLELADGLVDLAGMRIVSEVLDEVVWELLGEDLPTEVQVLGQATVLPHARLLSLRCTGGAPQILLPRVDLRDFDEPLRLELGIRVRPETAAAASPATNGNGAAPEELPPSQNGRPSNGSTPGQPTGSGMLRVISDWQAAERAIHAEMAQSLAARARADEQVIVLQARLHAADLAAGVLTEQLEGARAEQAEATRARDSERAALARAEEERERARAIEMARLQSEVRAAQGESAAVHAQADTFRQALVSYWEFVGSLDAELRTVLGVYRRELAASQAEALERSRQWEAGQEEARASSQRLAASQEGIRALSQQLESSRTELRDVSRQLEASQHQLQDADAEARELREERTQWQQDEEFLRQEIAGMQTELQLLDETMARTGQQQGEIQAALTEVRRRADDDRGRVRSMQRSASWQMTLPLRAINRLVSGKRPAQKRDAAGELPPPSEQEVAQGNGGWRFHLDQPTNWELAAQRVRFRGWCLPPVDSDKAVPTLRVRCGARTHDIPCQLPRPDVMSEVGGHPEWRLCGFDVKLDFPGGPSQVVIEVVEADGRAWLVGHHKVRAPYAAWAEPDAPADPGQDYAAWVERYDRLSAAQRRHVRAQARTLGYRPLISVVMPVYNAPEVWLCRAIDSVRAQLYPFWELCIADDASPAPHVREVLGRYERQDPRIKVVYREANGHISAASNSALALAGGEYVALLDHDDELPPHALYAVALELQDHPEADVLYSDEDKIDETGRRFSPYFKPDWNPDLLLGQNFVSHLGVYRREILNRVGGFRVGFEGCQDWDLVLRITEQIPAERIRHIPRVLYHWRAIEGSTARAVEEKDYIVEASRRVLAGHCERIGADAEILPVLGSHYRVRYRLPASPPLVSIIIPTHNQLKLLRQGIETLRAKTTYPHYEILVVDNRSDDAKTLTYLAALERGGEARVLRYPQPFNYSAINNHAVEQARGELVCLMNNDMEVITPGWLEEMASHALRPGVGAVGAILYYPDDKIQHAGVVLGIGGVAGHIFSRLPRGTDGYFNRARLVQNYSAVTAACLVIRRSTYQQVGGFNDALKVAFNDVDFCLKVQAAGFRNVWTPHAEFYHHESVSRGAEDTTEKYRRFVGEVDYMQAHWHAIIAADPAYNLNLAVEGGECHLGFPPRVPPLVMADAPGPSGRG